LFNKILVPLDGSDVSEWALTPAMQLAKAYQSEVIFLRCTFPFYMTTPVMALEYEWAWSESTQGDLQLEAKEYLDEVGERFNQPGVAVETIAVEGDPASMIVDTAVDEDVDLIVMSTHGWSGFKKWMLGSVTERVLYSGYCPVLIIHSPEAIHRMAITLDGSDLAEKALEPGLALAAGLKASVSLLRVSEPLPVGVNSALQFDWEVGKDTAYQIGHQNRLDAEVYLQDLSRQTARYDLDIQSSVEEGRPEDKILEYAGLHHIDLIAMSTHGRTGLSRWLFGSVTAIIMRSFSGHLLIVRP
jgi:nucleotide-binding universal stress UspA family protein